TGMKNQVQFIQYGIEVVRAKLRSERLPTALDGGPGHQLTSAGLGLGTLSVPQTRSPTLAPPTRRATVIVRARNALTLAKDRLRKGLRHETNHHPGVLSTLEVAATASDARDPRADVTNLVLPVSTPLLDPLATAVRRGLSRRTRDRDRWGRSGRSRSGRADAVAGRPLPRASFGPPGRGRLPRPPCRPG